MKIIYGNNGVGKTKYKNKMLEEGLITLTSDISDWMSKPIGGKDLFFSISQNAGVISNLKEEFKELINNIQRPDGITKINFQRFLSTYQYNDDKLDSLEFWSSNEFVVDGESINLSNLDIFLKEWKLIEWNEIKKKDRKYFYSIAEINNKISKAKRVSIENTSSRIENLFNKLINKYNRLSKKLKNRFPNIDGLLSTLTVKMLEAVFSEGHLFSREDEYSKSLVKYLDGIENKEMIVKLSKKILDLQSERIELSEPDNSINFDSTITNEDEYTISIESQKPLSSGQRTLLAIQIIMYSSSRDVILDDVMETLDSTNKNIAMKIIANYNEATILTHDTAIEEIALNITNSLSLEEPELLKIERNGVPRPSNGVSWQSIVPKIWNKTTDRAKFELMLCKVFMRYNAKIGVVQNIKGIQELDRLKEVGDMWFHWQESSIYIFHYNPSIPFDVLNNFFPALLLEENIDSVELVEMLIEKNNEFSEGDVLSVVKVSILLEDLSRELEKEKQIYDSHSDECRSHEEWNKKAFVVYNAIARSNNIPFKRKRQLIHSLDLSPVEIAK